MTPVIEVRGIVKVYRRGPETVRALDGVDLSLDEGEVVALLGPSGSGKTTLLNVLSGWEQPDEGLLLWEGANHTALDALPWHLLSVLPQRLGLLDELTMRENVELPLRLSGTLDSAGSERVEELLEWLGLARLAERSPAETSLGEQQRTALARAILPVPRLLLADEPAGHQDRASGDQVLRTLRAAARRGTACLLATHDRESVRFCDRAVEMVDGHVEPFGARGPLG